MTFCVCKICKTSGQVRTSRKPVNFIPISFITHTPDLDNADQKMIHFWLCLQCHIRIIEYVEGLKNEN